MPALSDWLIWAGLAVLDALMFRIGAPTWVFVLVTLMLFVSGAATSEWGHRQIARLSVAHRLRRARETASRRGLDEWLPLRTQIDIDLRAAQEAVKASILRLSSAILRPWYEQTAEAAKVGATNVQLGQRLNRRACVRCAWAVRRELKRLRKQVLAFEVGSANLAGWYGCLCDIAETRQRVSLETYRSAAQKYAANAAGDVPTLRGLMGTIRSNTWRKSRRMDSAISDYIEATERFARAYEAIGTAAQRLIALQRKVAITQPSDSRIH